MGINQKAIALISVHGDPAVEIGKEEAGGQNVYVRHIGEMLAQLGWQVDMFTRAADAQHRSIVQHSPRCRTIRLQAGAKDFIPRQEIFEHRHEFVQRWLDFQAQQDYQYDIVHTNYWISGWVGLELKRKLNLPMVHTYHSLGAIKYQSVRESPTIADIRLQVEKACLETADCVVATSPQEQKHMRLLVSQSGNITIIPCGTDVKRYGQVERQQARQRLGIHPDARVVLYVGRFDPRKGIETLVRAIGFSQWHNDPRLRLIIGGGYRQDRQDGQEKQRIEALVGELGLTEITRFSGRIGDDDLPLYYAAADVCVVPSHYEPFGLVAIEAMASYTPVVASDVGGLQYTVVSESTGLLVPPQQPQQFARAIDRILASPEWQQQLGSNARKRVETEFSWYGVAKHLQELYLKIIAAKS